MVKTNSRAKYRRLIIIYSLVIIVPGTFLSILAYRGIYGDLAMADRIIENRLERKSRYFFGGIEESIKNYTDAFLENALIWEDSLISLRPDSEANKLIKEKIVLAAAARKEDGDIKVLANSPSGFSENIMPGSGSLGNLYYHIRNNLNFSYSKETRQPSHVSFFNDTISTVLVTKIDQDYSIALLLDTKKLLQENIPILDETQSFPVKISWRLSDEYDRTIFTSPDFEGKKPTDFRNFGSWILQLEQVENYPISLIKEAEQQYLIVGFFFVIAVMGLGLIVTIRSLTNDYKLSQMKSDFVSTVSHEFKSPLTSIRMMSERLASRKVKKDERRFEYYNSMLAQSERLSHLVDNILDFSRIDRGRKTYHFEKCDLMKPAREVIEYLTIRHGEEGFDISLSSAIASPEAMVDCQGLHQVLYNLIENAIKYSGESRRIDVRISRSRNFLKISVRDFGIGISKKNRKRIFGHFYRVSDAGTSGTSGSGIGLSIVNEIIKAHHGKIELESEPGKGSVFSVYFPLTQKTNSDEKNTNN